MLIYSNIGTKRTYCEFWGGSTKHPDVRKCYQDDVKSKKHTLNDFLPADYDTFQWLVECCADLSFGTATELKKLLAMSNEYLEPMKKFG